jgi:hypothetical protein
MPGAAIATRCVDHMLPLEQIGAAVLALTLLPGAADWMRRHLSFSIGNFN